MSTNSYVVYKHTSPSKKVYIGITSNAPEKRWKNGKGYELCTAFNRAIKKYGWNQISHEILYSGLSKKQAEAKEVELIRAYRSNEPEFGYNLTSGGESYIPNDEWRERTSKSHKEYYKNHPEARARISESRCGKKATKSTREKMSISRKKYIEEHPEARERCRQTFLGMKRTKENCDKLRLANMKKIRCIDTGAVFLSVQEAAEFAGVCRTSVSNHLAGKSKSCGNYHFKYVNEVNNDGTDEND